jgi:hypothetical protein
MRPWMILSRRLVLRKVVDGHLRHYMGIKQRARRRLSEGFLSPRMRKQKRFALGTDRLSDQGKSLIKSAVDCHRFGRADTREAASWSRLLIQLPLVFPSTVSPFILEYKYLP